MEKISHWVDKKPYRIFLLLGAHTALFGTLVAAAFAMRF